MTKEKKETRSDDLIDALLEKHGISPEAVVGENGLIWLNWTLAKVPFLGCRRSVKVHHGRSK
jgi:hypothetical protein